MPIWLRRFTFQKLKEWYDKKNEEQSNQTSNNSKRVMGPGIDPSYSTKASR